MTGFHLDYETYSAADLKKVGGYRYACDPSTEILIFGIARNDEEPLVWDVIDSHGENKEALALLWEMRDDESNLVYAHNAPFEAAISKYLFYKTFGMVPPKLEQWRCTQAMARRAAIPSSLDGVGEFLNLNVKKDKEGKRLINKFSIPRKPTKKDDRTRILPADDVEDFRRFGEYCRDDVRVEREAHKVLHSFELKGDVLRSFQFDLRMNDLGVPVNVEALKRADAMINEYTERLTAKFVKMTGGLRPTQYDECFEWFRARGFPYDNLQSENVEEMLNNGPTGWEMRYLERKRELDLFDFCYEKGCPQDSKVKRKAWIKANRAEIPTRLKAVHLQAVNMKPEAFEALRVRSLISHAAAKKVPTMLKMACPDGRCRGAMLWSGAERTHRWAGRHIQPQNFRRSTKWSEQAYEMLCEGADIETLEMMFGPFLEIIATSIRHFIQWPEGEILQADYSAVEARGNPWLCNAEPTLQLFRDGVPVYELMAAKIFHVELDDVTTDQRFVGKQAILGCGYNMGRPKFRGTCESYNFTPPQSMVDEFKPRFRLQLAKMRDLCDNVNPWDEFELKFPKFKWARPRNHRTDGRVFSVYAYRKGGTGRVIKDPDNPTAEEWLDLTYDDLADRAVTTWRADNPEIVAAWKQIDIAAKKAIQNPGKLFHPTPRLTLGVTEKPGFRALIMRLPSGHTLVYPRPRLVWKGEEGRKDPEDYYNIQVEFWGKETGKSTWGWCKTYGGKLLENATQAVCGDLMANGACNATENEYSIFMLVHDEALAHKGENQTQEELCGLLCDLPKWAEGFPLAAEGNVIPFYKKT